jgi:uncharacterized protein (TIGR02453 family)
VFPRRGLEKQEAAGFYFGVSPEGAELVAGSYMPGPDQLRRLRAYFDERHAEFLRIVRAKPVATLFGDVQGERLKRVPRGYDPAHPAASLLRLNQCFLGRTLTRREVLASDFAGQIVDSFRAATPFVTAVDSALGNT